MQAVHSIQYRMRLARKPHGEFAAGAGTIAMRLNRAAVKLDDLAHQRQPDTETAASIVDSVGTVDKSSVFMITSASMEYIVDSETDFITTPFVRPVGQDARVAELLWMGALGVNNRRKNGVLYGILQSIAA